MLVDAVFHRSNIKKQGLFAKARRYSWDVIAAKRLAETSGCGSATVLQSIPADESNTVSQVPRTPCV